MVPPRPARSVARAAAARATLAFFLLAATSCGGGSNGSDNNSVVNGSASIGWDQQAADATELGTLRFAIYVDSVRSELSGASCGTPAGAAGFPCTAPLPALSPGQHSLQLASYLDTGTILESGKSAPLVITVATALTAGGLAVSFDVSAPAPVVPAPSAGRALETSDGARLSVSVLTVVDRPSALAIAADGSVFVGDDGGRVGVVRGGLERQTPASETLASGDSGGVLDLALDPQFARNHLIYVLDTVAGEPRHFRLARFRELSGQLGERAVLLDSILASPSHPAAALSFGPDGKLFLAVDDGGDGEGAQRAGTYNGKVLRLNADGTTPSDQRGGTPVFARGLTSPQGAAWDSVTGSLWIADTGQQRVERLRGGSRQAMTRTAFALPLAGGAGSLSLYRGTLIPLLDGSLLAAPAGEADYLLRVRFTGTTEDAVGPTERLTLAGVSRVRVVKVGPDGAIYVVSDRDVRRIAPR